MTTYVYEIIPAQAGKRPRYVEIKQGMNDAPLTKHPETGEDIRRVIFGGYGALSKASDSGSGSGCGCGPGQSCG
jgi:predicted nucleic acid-binding Zn ribbon protein